METSTNAVTAQSVTSLEHLSDAELLAGTRRLVGRSNQLLAELLAHLAEVEARKIHRLRACASLYTYCIYELRFSEDEAFRRVSAARLARRFPALLEALAAGELHLTGLLMLGPHLTEANLVEVLARAKHRTKRELGRLVRVLDPLPEVPARIEPLGPAPARLAHAPTWGQFMEALSPVRHLSAGDRPGDWVDGTSTDGALDGAVAEGTAGEGTAGEGAAGVGTAVEGTAVEGTAVEGAAVEGAAVEGAAVEGAAPNAWSEGAVMDDGTWAQGEALDGASTGDTSDHAANDASADNPPPVTALARVPRGPERYKVQFTATEEYVRLLDEAKALLSHAAPRVTLEELHLRAVRALVSELQKKKYATKSPDRAETRSRMRGATSGEGSDRDDAGTASPARAEATEDALDTRAAHPRRHGRRIPAAVRRAVFERDGNRCTFSDPSGRQCGETNLLEFHHLEPFAAGGAHTAANLTLRCRSHNALAAEDDFGRELIESRRGSGEDEPFAPP